MNQIFSSKELKYHIEKLGLRLKIDKDNIDKIMVLTGAIVNNTDYKFLKTQSVLSGVCYFSNKEAKFIIEV